MEKGNGINQNYQQKARKPFVERDSRYSRKNDYNMMLKDTHVEYKQQDVLFFANL